MSLNGKLCRPLLDAFAETVLDLAKFLTLSRIIEIPRSSEAFSSRTLCLNISDPKISRANARIVDVFPVPGGP